MGMVLYLAVLLFLFHDTHPKRRVRISREDVSGAKHACGKFYLIEGNLMKGQIIHAEIPRCIKA